MLAICGKIFYQNMLHFVGKASQNYDQFLGGRFCIANTTTTQVNIKNVQTDVQSQGDKVSVIKRNCVR